ncbi:MAG: MFS transporter [Edaphobacter sp.]|uniref:MFS transporter n=1 Tax=Edaphobacter sp. TaxID=1934404 RepID=UPI002382319E|nr:MFS transporter [Edaphobacter sp.]MDE1178476.1 MFS transporter [Edaphobacter sp.]
MNECEGRFSRQQWVIIALLFVVALINYFDRQSLSVVAPRVQAELGLGDEGYAHIVSVFLFASAVAYGISGFVSDWLGTRRSMALFVGWWSLAEAATTFASSVWMLALARFCLGLGEPGLWVAAPKAVGESFDEKQRGLACGIYTMGATVGAIIALPVIVMVTTHLPWRSIFLLDGVVGLLWIPLWLWCYRKDKSEEKSAGMSATSNTREVLLRSSTWKLLVARSLTDPVWYFFLFWFPKYLSSARHLPMTQLAKIGWVVYLGAGLGTIAGGLLSRRLIRGGMSVGVAYRWTMLAAAVLVPLSPLAALVPSYAASVAIASIIALAHMAWLVTLTATVIELYPQNQVGKAAGLIAMGSGFGGMLSSEIVGYLVTHGGYTPVFFLMAMLHPIALALLWPVYRQGRSVVRDIAAAA